MPLTATTLLQQLDTLSAPELRRLLAEHLTRQKLLIAFHQGSFLMPYLLQVDFPMPGPFGAAMVQAFTDLAHSINQEPGMRWKIWTENAQAQEAGGVYLFDTQEQAQAYLNMHSQRLTQAGVRDIRSRIFAVNEALTAINHGPVTTA